MCEWPLEHLVFSASAVIPSVTCWPQNERKSVLLRKRKLACTREYPDPVPHKPMKRGPLSESDLYLPVKRFLESQGYEVKGEVRDCDVAAVRGDEELVVVELKLSLNLELILQAVERLAVTSKVYVGVPVGNHSLRRRRRQTVKLLRMLGLGLLVVDPDVERHGVDAVLDPGEYRPRRSRRRRELLLGEFVRRVGDPNLGGASVRNGIMTAYRQRALEIALFLQTNGPTKASQVATAIGDPKARDILYRDVYGWFDRPSNGIYALSPRGVREVPLWAASRQP